MRISDIPTAEILQHRIDAREDIALCEMALRFGVTTYSGGSVADRLAANWRQIEVMDAEILRRAAPAGSEVRA